MLFMIQIGSVVISCPAVNVVTTISSKLNANANRPPANSEDLIRGKVTSLNVVQTPAPKSAEASSVCCPSCPRRGKHVVVDRNDGECHMRDNQREHR